MSEILTGERMKYKVGDNVEVISKAYRDEGYIFGVVIERRLSRSYPYRVKFEKNEADFIFGEDDLIGEETVTGDPRVEGTL